MTFFKALFNSMALLYGDSYWREAQGSRSPRRFRSALVGSLLFHCSLGGLVSAVALQKPAVIEPIVIDLTAAELPEAPTLQRSATNVAGSGQHRSAPVRPAPVAPPQVPAPAPTKPIAATQPAPAATQPAIGRTTTAALASQSGPGNQTGTQSQGQAGSGTSTGQGTGSGQAAADRESLQKRYLREHFAYIRDLISKQLHYPRRAIRMGWSGQVTVSFVVLVDGSVAELRVSRSSGVPLLDRNALETVERAAPFPKPPVSARLLMPVDYILE